MNGRLITTLLELLEAIKSPVDTEQLVVCPGFFCVSSLTKRKGSQTATSAKHRSWSSLTMPVQELIFSVVKNLDVPGLMRGVEVHGGADGAGLCGVERCGESL